MPDETNKSILGFDYGTKKIGTAIGQSLLGTAKPLVLVSVKQGTPDWAAIEALIKEWQPDELVVGIPYNMDGTEQGMTHAARRFANQLRERFKLLTHGVDERLSTREAREMAFNEGGYRALQNKDIDCIAAQLITESWMRENS